MPSPSGAPSSRVPSRLGANPTRLLRAETASTSDEEGRRVRNAKSDARVSLSFFQGSTAPLAINQSTPSNLYAIQSVMSRTTAGAGPRMVARSVSSMRGYALATDSRFTSRASTGHDTGLSKASLNWSLAMRRRRRVKSASCAHVVCIIMRLPQPRRCDGAHTRKRALSGSHMDSNMRGRVEGSKGASGASTGSGRKRSPTRFKTPPRCVSRSAATLRTASVDDDANKNPNTTATSALRAVSEHTPKDADIDEVAFALGPGASRGISASGGTSASPRRDTTMATRRVARARPHPTLPPQVLRRRRIVLRSCCALLTLMQQQFAT